MKLHFETLESRYLLAGVSMPAGFELSRTMLEVSESGVSDAFEVVLISQPSSNVVIDVIDLDPSETAVSPNRLVFSPDNWDSPQVVFVSGVPDFRVDGSRTSIVTVRVDEQSSSASYHGLEEQSVYVLVYDDDVLGFHLSEYTLTVSESGTTASFSVVLTDQPQTNVTFEILSENEAEATVAPAVITFTPDDWDRPQIVTVTGVDDLRLDGNQETSITVTVNTAVSDRLFSDLPGQVVRVVTLDDDVAGFTVSKNEATVSETGTTDSFWVVLTVQPDEYVVLAIAASDSSEATVDPTTLVFSPLAWDQPQEVTITGVDDSLLDGDQRSLVEIAVDVENSDAKFADAAARTVSVTTLDDEHSWQNPTNAFDVDGDGYVSAADVLAIINHINSAMGESLLPPAPMSPPPYYDVNNDGRCTALDILLVINHINHQPVASPPSGEGESESEIAPSRTDDGASLRAIPQQNPSDSTESRGASAQSSEGRGIAGSDRWAPAVPSPGGVAAPLVFMTPAPATTVAPRALRPEVGTVAATQPAEIFARRSTALRHTNATAAPSRNIRWFAARDTDAVIERWDVDLADELAMFTA